MDEAAARVSELTRLCIEARARRSRDDGARRTTAERFERFYAAHEPLFREAIAAWAAVERAPVRPTAELAALSRVALEDDALVIDRLWGGFDDGLSYVGTELGYFYGGQPWGALCVVRSGIELLAALAGHDDPSLASEACETMARWAHEMFRPQEIPERIPASHWWWRGPQPA